MLWFQDKSLIWKLPSLKTIIPPISLVRVLNHFLINCIHLKLLLRMCLKEMFLLSCRSREVLCFKFDKLTPCNLNIIFPSSVRVKSFVLFKDRLCKMLLSGLVYKYKCGGYNATYYSKNKCRFKVQICDFICIWHLEKR